MKSWYLPRRTFLHGAGTAILLPMLDAMVPRYAKADILIKPRFSAVFMPMGIYGQGYDRTKTGAARYFHAEPFANNGQGAWRPFVNSGALPANLPVILEPLNSWRSKMTIVSGLSSQPGVLENSQHSLATTAWLTAGWDTIAQANAKPSWSSNKISLSPPNSVDQVIANSLGITPGSSLVMNGSSQGSAGGGSESNGGYLASVSYNRALGGTNIVSKINNPVTAFNSIINACVPTGGSTPQLTNEQLNDGHVLDRVIASIGEVKKNLGQDDRVRLESYLSFIEDLEKKVKGVGSPSGGTWCPKPGELVVSGEDWVNKVNALIDVMAFGLATGVRPVSTLMTNTEYKADMLYAPFVASHGNFIGVSGSKVTFDSATVDVHNDVVHKARKTVERCEEYIAYNRAQILFSKRLMEKLDGFPAEPNGNKPLDNCLILVGACHGDGNLHRTRNIPTLLLGGKKYGLNQGQHIALQMGSDIGNFHYTMLKALGVDVNDFNGHNKILSGVFSGI